MRDKQSTNKVQYAYQKFEAKSSKWEKHDERAIQVINTKTIKSVYWSPITKKSISMQTHNVTH